MFRGIAEDQVVEDLVVEEVVVHQERTIMQQDGTTPLSSPTSTTTENKEEEEVISTNDQTSQDSSSPNGCPLSFNDEDVVSVIINQTATTNTVMKASLNNNNTINNHHHYENKDSSMLAGTIRSTSNAPSSSTPTTTSTTITSSSSSSSSTNNNNTDNRMIEEEEVLSIAVQGCNTPSSTSSDATLGNENNNNNQQKRSFLLLSSLFDSSSLNSSSSTTSSSSMMMSREEETIRSSTSRSSTLAVATSNSHNNCIHSNIGVTLSPLLMSSSNLSNSNISTTVGTAITSTVNSSTMTVGILDNSTIGTNINNEESYNSNEQDDEQMMTLNNNTTMEEEEIMMDNNNDVSVNDNLNEEEGIMHLVQKQKEEHDEKLIIPNEQMNCLNFPNFNDKLNVDIPNHYLCPITKLIMINPVKNMYNKIYEKEGIEQWWKTLQNKNQKLTDPLTNQIITDKTLTEELSLREEIQLFLQQNLTLKFSMNEIYFPKQFIREMKVAIDGNDLEKVKKLLIQFPISFFIQTKFPVPTSGKHANGSTSSGKNSEKETAVSIFDCLYKRFKYLHDRNNLKSNNNLMVNDYLQDPIIYFVMNQFLIVKNYLNNNLTICNNKNNDNIEIKTTIHAMNDGLKNIFVNSIRLFPNKYLLDWFLSLGAPLHSVNQFKQNAFHMACMTDQLEIASYLLEMVNLKQQQSNNQLCSAMIEERLSDDVKKKWNAFQLAIWHQSDKIIDWMINSEELISKFIIKKPKCLVRDKSGIFHPMNALSLSSYKKNIKLMEVLINKFNYNLCDDKYHPIYWSCIASDLDGFKWICNFIKENIGIDKLILQLKGINDRAFKRSLIHAISMEASDEMMDYYLNLCSELNIIDSIINVQDNFGNTALHYACEKSRTKMIESLIQNGIAHEYFNKQGKTAVQCCKTEEDRDTIQKAIRKERELLKNVLVKVKELETDVQWLKRKLMEMESNDVKKTKME